MISIYLPYMGSRVHLLILTVLLFALFYFPVRPVAAQQRYATCDQCGYCQGKTIPQDWEQCRQCLYPEASTNANANDTLLITGPDAAATNTFEQIGPPTPAPGRYYTQIGCIRTNLNSFTQDGAAGSVVQVLLNIIFSTAGGIAFLYIIYGSFILITSQANPERISYGKRIVVGAIVGLLFCVGSVFIVNLIGSGILHLPSFGGTTSP